MIIKVSFDDVSIAKLHGWMGWQIQFRLRSIVGSIRVIFGKFFCGLILLCIAVGTAHCQIFVTYPNDSTVGAYTTSGSTISASYITGFNTPEGIAVSGTDVFVSDFGTGTIGEYTTSGQTVNATLITGLYRPFGIAISGTCLYVANDQATLAEYSTSGALVNATLVPALADTDTFELAVSGSYIFTLGALGVNEYTTSGVKVNTSGLFVDSDPNCMAVSGTNLYVGNYDGSMSVFNTAGATENSKLFTGLNDPVAIAFAGSDMFIANAGGGGRISEYTTSGTPLDATLVTDINYVGGMAIAEPVPEPDTWGMLVLGTMLFLNFGRRRK